MDPLYRIGFADRVRREQGAIGRCRVSEEVRMTTKGSVDCLPFRDTGRIR
jgi:hypothetical protein